MITPAFNLTATERVLPRLALDWTTGLTQTGVDVVRAGVATFVGSNGFIQSATANTQRIDWTTGVSGLLVEEARTNTFIRSQAFNVTPWAIPRLTIVANTTETLSPSGDNTATKLSQAAGQTTAGALVYTTALSATDGQKYTYAIYAKAGTNRNFIVLEDTFVSATASQTWFNVLTGTVGTTSANHTASMSSLDNVWYRCVVTVTAVGSSATRSALFRIAETNGSLTVTDNQGFIYAYGAQTESGAFPTSYIPTTTAAVTRNADVATMTGTNFSSFWQGMIGGAMVQAIPSTVSGIRPLVQYDDGTVNNIIALRGNTTNPELQIVTGGAPQAQIDAGTIAANTPYSLTGWWSLNDCRARKDAGAVVIDNTATIPTVTQARLGSDGTNYLNGHLMTVNYYDRFSSQIYTRRKNKAVFSLL